jgi:hypothetical protein
MSTRLTHVYVCGFYTAPEPASLLGLHDDESNRYSLPEGGFELTQFYTCFGNTSVFVSFEALVKAMEYRSSYSFLFNGNTSFDSKGHCVIGHVGPKFYIAKKLWFDSRDHVEADANGVRVVSVGSDAAVSSSTAMTAVAAVESVLAENDAQPAHWSAHWAAQWSEAAAALAAGPVAEAADAAAVAHAADESFMSPRSSPKRARNERMTWAPSKRPQVTDEDDSDDARGVFDSMERVLGQLPSGGE